MWSMHNSKHVIRICYSQRLSYFGWKEQKQGLRVIESTKKRVVDQSRRRKLYAVSSREWRRRSGSHRGSSRVERSSKTWPATYPEQDLFSIDGSRGLLTLQLVRARTQSWESKTQHSCVWLWECTLEIFSAARLKNYPFLYRCTREYEDVSSCIMVTGCY